MQYLALHKDSSVSFIQRNTHLHTMFEYYHFDPFILSSSCPYSSSLVTSAIRIGGTLDPEFLNQCHIIDKKLEKKIGQLKQTPIKYELSPNFIYQEELFLDIDISNKKQFFDSSEFKQYNSWLENQHQWNILCSFNNDIII